MLEPNDVQGGLVNTKLSLRRLGFKLCKTCKHLKEDTETQVKQGSAERGDERLRA